MNKDTFYFMRKNPVDLLRYLPRFLAKDPTFKNLEDTLSWEHEQYRLKLVDIAKQFFLETSTWGLPDWERFLGITPTEGQSFELRKNIARVKLRGADTMTVENTIKLMHEFMTAGEADVEELGDYEIRLILDNGVFHWKEMFQALFEYLPAHLDFSMKFSMHDELPIYVGHSEVYADKETILNAALPVDQNQIFINTALQDVIHDEALTDFSALKSNELQINVAHLILEVEHEEILSGELEGDDKDYWEWERFLWRIWRKYRHNPIIKEYAHHFPIEPIIIDPDPDDPTPDELISGNWLRLYFKFPYSRYQKTITIPNPRDDLKGSEINSLSAYVAENHVIVNSRWQISDGIARALYIRKSVENILGGEGDAGYIHKPKPTDKGKPPTF